MQSDHQVRVAAFLSGIGHNLPEKPQVGDREKLRTWGQLLLEEVFEWIEAAGLSVDHTVEDRPLLVNYKSLQVVIEPELQPDLVKMADANADISVVNTGAMLLNGISDTNILEEVDQNNLLKVSTGKMDTVSGKFIKARNHPKPNFAACLAAQSGPTE